MGVKTRKLGNINNQIVEWQTVHVSDGSTALTTVAGRGYFINTTSGAQTVNLPGTPRFGDRVSLKDFARTWGTNAITMGSNKFDGVTSQTPIFNTTGQTVSLIYMGSAQGWSLINEDTTTNLGKEYVAATGGTITTDGDYKIHTFTGDSNFVVSNAGNPAGNNKLEYLVVAGAGGAGYDTGGGSGAGGFRFASTSIAPLTYPAKPLAGSELTAAQQTYPVTVGGGGTSQASGGVGAGASGSNSVFSTITSAGGGGGGSGGGSPGIRTGLNGGSGGGGGNPNGSGGAGNTPPVSPAQGTGGGDNQIDNVASGGGGGAIQAGQDTQPSDTGGYGGDGGGLPTAFGSNGVPCGSYRYYAGGGGGGGRSPGHGPAGAGGKGGGGAGVQTGPGNAGTANSGGGAGGPSGTSIAQAGAGGKGIVVIRYKFQN